MSIYEKINEFAILLIVKITYLKKLKARNKSLFNEIELIFNISLKLFRNSLPYKVK